MNLKCILAFLAILYSFSCHSQSLSTIDSVRGILIKRYADLAKANDEQDMKKILSFKTDDFHTIGPDGRVSDHIMMEEFSRRFITNNIPPFNVKFTILNLKVSGNRIVAVADVLQESSRRREIEGVTRNIRTRVVQTETWVYVDKAWKLKLVDNVRGQETRVDGKRVDPTKPYNQSDPPYNPTTTTKQAEWLKGSWRGMYNNEPFYEAWRKMNDSVLVNFKIEIKGKDTVVTENGAIMLSGRFSGYRSKDASWELVSLLDEKIVLRNDTLKYSNLIVWSHSLNDHWLTELHNPSGQVVYYDMERVPWLESVVNKFIETAQKQ